MSHAPIRKHKPLLHKFEILRIGQKASAKGCAVVPFELYFIGGRARVEITLAKSKQEQDEHQALREKRDKHEAERAMRCYTKCPQR